MPKQRNRETSSSSSSTTTVSTPQLCPKEAIRVLALAKTTTGGGGGGLCDLAKNHLLATGWSLFQARKSTGEVELRYRSPAGKLFYSLRTACRSVLALETTSSSSSKMNGSSCEDSNRNNNKRKKTEKKMRSIEDIMKDDRSMMTSGVVVAGVLGRPTPVTGRGDLYWTLLKSEQYSNKIHRLKLKQALQVMHECFAPCVDPVTHKDVAEDIILNQERDFYTVVLELQADEVVTVATVRVHEEGGVAEVPLVATALKFQRQGMCQLLMDEIGNWLRGIGVSRVVLPSAESALKTWTSEKMGFSIMGEDEVDDLFTAYGDIVDFQGTTMCQKQLLLVSMNKNTNNEKYCDDAAVYSSDDDDGSTVSHEEHVCINISAADRAVKLRQAHINYY